MADDPDEDLLASFEEETAILMAFLEARDLAGWDPSRPDLHHPEYRRGTFLERFSLELGEILSTREFLLLEGDATEQRLEELVTAVRRLNWAWFQDAVYSRFPGDWIAVDRYQVVDHDSRLGDLLDRTGEREANQAMSIYHAVQPETA